MIRRINVLILSCIVILCSITACDDDNKGYEEDYHPMGNNPVQVVPWLKKLKKSLYKNSAQISLYDLEEKEYYVVQSFIPVDTITVSPYTIYEANDKREIIYYHSDNINTLESEQDEDYIYFIENADLIQILWSNAPK